MKSLLARGCRRRSVAGAASRRRRAYRRLGRIGRAAGRDGRSARRTGPAARANRPLPRHAAGPDAAVRRQPAKVSALNEWMAANPTLKGSELQDAAAKSPGSTRASSRSCSFPSRGADGGPGRRGRRISARRSRPTARPSSPASSGCARRRAQAGKLKSTPQQAVETKTTSSGRAGDRHRARQPADRLRAAIQPAGRLHAARRPSSCREDNTAEAVAAGLIGFTAGIAIGAAIDNDYYYGPYGWHGGGYMYNDAWDDYYDDREDAREDWQDHREDMVEERGDRAETCARRARATARRPQQQRTDRSRRHEQRSGRPTQRRRRNAEQRAANGAAAREGPGGGRGYSSGDVHARSQRHESDAFSGYSSGKSERAASSRGSQPQQLAQRRAAASRADDGIVPYVIALMSRARAALAVRRACRSATSGADAHLPVARRRREGAHGGVKTGKVDEVMAIFGPEGQPLIDSSDPATARHNAEVFSAAVAEGWHLESPDAATRGARDRQRGLALPVAAREGGRRMAVRHGRRHGGGAGAAHRTQRARGDPRLPHLRHRPATLRARGHDGQAGRTVRQTGSRAIPARQNGLYWPAVRGEKRSPLGDLVAYAAQEGRPPRTRGRPSTAITSAC